MMRDWTSAPATIWHGGRIVAPGDDSADVAAVQSALDPEGIRFVPYP